jgi:hypothetical protein
LKLLKYKDLEKISEISDLLKLNNNICECDFLIHCIRYTAASAAASASASADDDSSLPLSRPVRY